MGSICTMKKISLKGCMRMKEMVEMMIVFRLERTNE